MALVLLSTEGKLSKCEVVEGPQAQKLKSMGSILETSIF